MPGSGSVAATVPMTACNGVVSIVVKLYSGSEKVGGSLSFSRMFTVTLRKPTSAMSSLSTASTSNW